MVAEVIGSSPVVGSSNSITSGSRASERARATRLRMPPERSEGILLSTSVQLHQGELLAAPCRRSPPRRGRCARAAGRRRCRTRSSSRTGRRSGRAWRCGGGAGTARARSSVHRSVPSKTTLPRVGPLEAVELAQGHALAGARAAEDDQALAAAGRRSRGRRARSGRRTSWSGRGPGRALQARRILDAVTSGCRRAW